MPLRLPKTINVKRIKGNTFAEIFSVSPMPSGASAELEVEGLGTLTGTVDETAETISFPVTESAIADALAATYDYKINLTADALVRTIVQGSWIVSVSSVP